MAINKQQVISALTHVIHPVLGKDLITLNMIQDVIVQENFITFTVELVGKNPEIASQLKEHCENTILKYVSSEAILDIQTDYSPAKLQEVEDKEVEETLDSGLNPMSMSLSDSSNYAPPSTIDAVPYEKMPTLLQQYMDEHQEILEEIDRFEKALLRFKIERWIMDEEMTKAFSRFFNFLDTSVLDHNRREEKQLFPLLQKRLLQTGEHSSYNKYMSDEDPRTGVELMEDEHITFIQLSTLIFNFMGLAPQLPDVYSQSIVSDLAYEQGVQLIEMLRLHILREDQTLFPLACQLIDENEFEDLFTVAV